ncbi:MAG: hypothetical protein V3U16_00625 [Candidatus Neomarinimicrobiota bacterium]
MSILEDLASEISGYAKEFIEIKIDHFTPYGSYGGQWDVDDVGLFTIQVKNKGLLEVKNIRIHINVLYDGSGNRYGQLRYQDWEGHGESHYPEWQYSLEVGLWKTLGAKSPFQAIVGLFDFQALRDTGGAESNLIECHLAEYDVSLDNLLYDSTEHEWTVETKAKALIRGD